MSSIRKILFFISAFISVVDLYASSNSLSDEESIANTFGVSPKAAELGLSLRKPWNIKRDEMQMIIPPSSLTKFPEAQVFLVTKDKEEFAKSYSNASVSEILIGNPAYAFWKAISEEKHYKGMTPKLRGYRYSEFSYCTENNHYGLDVWRMGYTLYVLPNNPLYKLWENLGKLKETAQDTVLTASAPARLPSASAPAPLPAASVSLTSDSSEQEKKEDVASSTASSKDFTLSTQASEGKSIPEWIHPKHFDHIVLTDSLT